MEGRPNDAHAGFVTGGACACFQNRCAFILAIAAAAGVGSAGISQIGREMFQINELYHGRDEILDYSVYCAQTNLRDRLTYTEFMMQSYPNESDHPPVLKAVAEKGQLPQVYYNSVLLKLSPSEFQEDRERALSSSYSSSSTITAKRLFSVEDATTMLFSKKSVNVLRHPNKWNIPTNKGFNVTPRIGDDFISTAAKLVSILELVQLINSSNVEQQTVALNELGIEIMDNELKIVFHEKDPSRNGLLPNSSGNENFQSASISLSFREDLILPFDLKVSDQSFVSDGVNFWGGLTVLGNHFVPVPGRGTIAVEPYGAQQAYTTTGPVYSGVTASFVTRCALVLSICKCFGATQEQLQQVREMLCSVDYGLHNKSDMICYMAECLKNSKTVMPSYTAFISFVYDQKSWSSSLSYLLKNSCPDQAYFASVTQYLSAEELEQDQKMTNREAAKAVDEVDCASILGLTFFPYRARLGKDFPRMSDSKMCKLSEMFEQFAIVGTLEKQAALFDMKISGGIFAVNFIEAGNPYANQLGDRTEVVKGVKSSISLQVPLPEPSAAKNVDYKPMQVSLKPLLDDHVNYTGMLKGETPSGEKREVPLVGRGTIGLEGKESGDCHSGLATGPNCSTFQNRAAVVLMTAATVGLNEDSIRQVYYMLKGLDDCYHGRGLSLDYVFYCVRTSSKNRKSYLEFVKEKVTDEYMRNCTVTSLLSTGKVGEKTLLKVLGKLSPEEQQEDLDALDTGGHDHHYHHHHSGQDSEDSKITDKRFSSAHRDWSKPSKGSASAATNTEQRHLDNERHVHFHTDPVQVIDLEATGDKRAAEPTQTQVDHKAKNVPTYTVPNFRSTEHGVYSTSIIANSDSLQTSIYKPLSTSNQMAAMIDLMSDSANTSISTARDEQEEVNSKQTSGIISSSSSDKKDGSIHISKASSELKIAFDKTQNDSHQSEPSALNVSPYQANEKNLSAKNEGLLETIAKHLNPASIKVRPRMGVNFKNFVGQSFSIYDVVTTFRRKQSEALSMLGISIEHHSKTFSLIYREEGTPYLEPSGNRSKLASTSKIMEASYSVRLARNPPEDLDLNISLVPFESEGVNYIGRITFNSPLNEYRYIPLVGRGTIALEGKEAGDAHCTVCVSGYSATFQQRVAFCFAILACCGGTTRDLDDLSTSLKAINDLFHGRDELFYYTLQCSKNPASSLPTYFKFMSHLYPIPDDEGKRKEQELSRIPPNLLSSARSGKPCKSYYAQLIDEMSRDEIKQDQLNTSTV